MRWLLAGCWGLAFISFSVAPDPDLKITQKPRFYGVRTRRDVGICCLSPQVKLAPGAMWYKADRHGEEEANRRKIEAGKKYQFFDSHSQKKYLLVHNVRVEDSGVYFCKLNGTWGPGTALQVARVVDVPTAVHRTKMKDGLIVLQGLLLAACIAAVLLRKRQLSEKKEIIYEEPETDHIYEGLAIESCGGGEYEELSVYARADETEAPWE
ncbi:B-cell antigen receptor complex-associated protein beta chain [Gasterosteus aculeatus]